MEPDDHPVKNGRKYLSVLGRPDSDFQLRDVQSHFVSVGVDFPRCIQSVIRRAKGKLVARMPEEPVNKPVKRNGGEATNQRYVIPTVGGNENQRLSKFKYPSSFSDHCRRVAQVLKGIPREEQIHSGFSKREMLCFSHDTEFSRVSSEGPPILVQTDYHLGVTLHCPVPGRKPLSQRIDRSRAEIDYDRGSLAVFLNECPVGLPGIDICPREAGGIQFFVSLSEIANQVTPQYLLAALRLSLKPVELNVNHEAIPKCVQKMENKSFLPIQETQAKKIPVQKIESGTEIKGEAVP